MAEFFVGSEPELFINPVTGRKSARIQGIGGSLLSVLPQEDAYTARWSTPDITYTNTVPAFLSAPSRVDILPRVGRSRQLVLPFLLTKYRLGKVEDASAVITRGDGLGVEWIGARPEQFKPYDEVVVLAPNELGLALLVRDIASEEIGHRTSELIIELGDRAV